MLTAIIVAAGYSFRMKQFKPLLSLGKSTVLERAVESFLRGGIEDIRVVVGHRGSELYPVLDRLGVQAIVNPNFAEGMFSSVQAGVYSLSSDVRGFFLLPVDNPMVNPHTVKKLQSAFFSTEYGIIYPAYQGLRGHPPIISSRFISKIMAWKGTGGLRALLQQYEEDALEIEVEDPGVLLDMDTPEDYQQMLNYCGYGRIPSEKECCALFKDANTPGQVIDHSRKVADLSMAMASLLVRRGCLLNMELIRASALLHDLAKGVPNHAQAGADRLFEYPEVAEIVAEHTDISLIPSERSITEKEIVYLADKLVKDDGIVSLQARFTGLLEQYRNHEEVFNKIMLRLRNAEIIQSKIEAIIMMPLAEIWTVKQGGQG